MVLFGYVYVRNICTVMQVITATLTYVHYFYNLSNTLVPSIIPNTVEALNKYLLEE